MSLLLCKLLVFPISHWLEQRSSRNCTMNQKSNYFSSSDKRPKWRYNFIRKLVKHICIKSRTAQTQTRCRRVGSWKKWWQFVAVCQKVFCELQTALLPCNISELRALPHVIMDAASCWKLYSHNCVHIIVSLSIYPCFNAMTELRDFFN